MCNVGTVHPNAAHNGPHLTGDDDMHTETLADTLINTGLILVALSVFAMLAHAAAVLAA